jgi:hypothetical protein
MGGKKELTKDGMKGRKNEKTEIERSQNRSSKGFNLRLTFFVSLAQKGGSRLKIQCYLLI